MAWQLRLMRWAAGAVETIRARLLVRMAEADPGWELEEIITPEGRRYRCKRCRAITEDKGHMCPDREKAMHDYIRRPADSVWGRWYAAQTPAMRAQVERGADALAPDRDVRTRLTEADVEALGRRIQAAVEPALNAGMPLKAYPRNGDTLPGRIDFVTIQGRVDEAERRVPGTRRSATVKDNCFVHGSPRPCVRCDGLLCVACEHDTEAHTPHCRNPGCGCPGFATEDRPL